VIAALREAKAMTQRELAAKVGVTPGYLALLELGKRKNPSLDVVKKLARALGVPVGELLE